jgi:hypothetical protein
MIGLDPAYRAEFQTWRSSREAWKNLVRAIREERPRAEVDQLAPAAGVTLTELLDLIAQHWSAKAHQEEVVRLPEARRLAREAKAKREALAKRLDEHLTPNEEAQVRDHLRVAESVEESTARSVSTIEMSQQFVDVGKATGVL